jgi:protein phosphatase inhibitor 2
MHIDIPPNPPSRAPGDLPESLEARILGESDMPIDLDGNHDHGDGEAVDLEPTTPSAARPPPAKGILKNGLRRPSQIGEGDQPATEAERVQWDEKNLVDTEAEKNSTM